ncbi:MAG: creatininase family protein [Pirellulales bacterium]|nr:creatininase family protein [Pirellulales bacterium]
MLPWKLFETNYATVKKQSYEVAVLPLGAIEPHNLHLPYGSDCIEADLMGQTICEAAHERGAKVILLPTIPYGTETNLQRFPLALNLNPSTLNAVIADLVESLVKSNIHKIVLFNSHGGNDIKVLLREMYGRTEAQLFLCNWYQILGDVYDEIFDAPEDHAGEVETSFMLAYRPDLVLRNQDGSLAADDGKTAEFRFEALRKGWVSITRPWHLLTKNAGAANPHAATAEKGRRLMEVLVDRLATFLVELSDAQIDERFPFK